MRRARKRILIALLMLAPALLASAIFVFAPKAATPRDEALPPGDWSIVATGVFQDGDRRHPASGNVSLLEDNGTYLLSFAGYTARSGPDVWFYLVGDASADSARAVEDDGKRVRVPGPGHATYRGQFHVPLDDLEPDRYGALVAWCKTFNTRYAVAPLVPAHAPMAKTETL